MLCHLASLSSSLCPKKPTTNSLITAQDEQDQRDKGATAVEYALMAALIAGVIVAVVLTLGQQVLALFSSVPPF